MSALPGIAIRFGRSGRPLRDGFDSPRPIMKTFELRSPADLSPGARAAEITVILAPAIAFAPGTVLLREWGQREHRVTVNAEGRFDYEGRSYKSLTALARHITGQHWSGPGFFGLTERKR